MLGICGHSFRILTNKSTCFFIAIPFAEASGYLFDPSMRVGRPAKGLKVFATRFGIIPEGLKVSAMRFLMPDAERLAIMIHVRILLLVKELSVHLKGQILLSAILIPFIMKKRRDLKSCSTLI